MTEMLDGYPDDVAALSATGRVTAEDDRSVPIPEAERRLQRHRRIGFLNPTDVGFDGFSSRALPADAEFGIGHLRHRHRHRAAPVTDVIWIRDATRFFAAFFHVPTRAFPSARFDAARNWTPSEK